MDDRGGADAEEGWMHSHADLAVDGSGTTRAFTVDGPVAAVEFVPLAIAIARALDEWHRHRGPHVALCPDAIRVDGSGEIRIDAGPTAPPPVVYAAPEQSGRLESGVDERTDLYVLGILYYQLLTGRLPFDAATPAQWWHCHLTEPPRPPADLVAGLPPALSEIVTLLLAKSPQDRYQTADGLAADLERCQDRSGAGSTPLPLRTRDLPGRPAFSGRLHGRERQLGRLQSAYDRVAAGGPAELVAVTADPGLGRWATVTRFADSVVTGGGRTLRAACAHDDARPYASLARLLTDLAGQLADLPAEQRARIADAVSDCGETLTHLVPALRSVFGGRPPAGGSAAAAGHRMRLATRRLLGALTGPGRPLVVAIRDVQWVDEPTIELLRYVMAAPDAPAVLAVVTYRPADLGPDHPVQALLSDERVSSSSVALRPLPDSALAELLAETLGCGSREASRLSRVVAARTGSNPLLVRHFLHELADRDLLSHPAEGATWQWEQPHVDDGSPAAGLTALVRSRLGRFTRETRDALHLAAVLGPGFDAVTLAAATADEPAGTADEPAGTDLAGLLRPAVRAELVDPCASPGEYRWRHEQLRQAVLAEIGQSHLAQLRLTAGRALARHPATLFDAVAQLNAAAGLLSLPDERRQLAELNADAGARAARLGALADARRYFDTALAVLGSEAWRHWPDLALRLHLAAAGAERSAAGQETAERATAGRAAAARLLDTAAGHAGAATDRARLLGVRAMLCLDAGDEADAVRVGIEALHLLGLAIPADPAGWREAGIAAAERLREQLDDDALDKITNAPECTDPRVVLATDLIADLAQPIWPDRSGRDLLVTAGVALAVEHGPTAATGYLLSRLAAVFAQNRQDPDASRFAAAGLCLLERPGTRYPALVRAAAAVLGPFWLDGPAPMIRELYAAYRTAVEEGEVRLAQRIGAVYSVHLFAVGAPLDQVAADIEARWRFAQRHGGDGPAGAVTRLLENAVSRLRRLPGDSPAPTTEELATLQRIVRGEYRYYTVVGLSPLLAPAHVLDDNGDLAQLNGVIGQVVARSPSTFLTAETTFWHAFSLVQRYESAEPGQRTALRAELVELQDKLDDLAARGPGLLRARALLLSAERARLAGRPEQARSRYDGAIAAARESDFVRCEAFAAERGGRYALARGEVGDAVAYLRRARACYLQWGAEAKLDQIDGLLATASRPAGTTRTLDQLDLLTVVRAFQSISGELRRDELVRVLLELLVRHSQAERGCLLLADGTGLRPAAEAEVDRDSIRVSTQVGSALRDRVPIEVIEYAGRNRQVLAGGPDTLQALVADPYLAGRRPRSVLCAPIVRRDNLLAVLYLEHRRLASAFSTFYLDLLDVLCTQAAVALENASVHARLVEANRILDATFDRLPVGLVLLGPELTVRRVSPQAAEILGLPITPGTPLAELFDVLTPTDVAGNPYRLNPDFAAGPDRVDPIDREIMIATPGGGWKRLSISAIPLRDETGGLVGVTVLVSRGQ